MEIASFLNQSPERDLEEALGQYEIYRTLLGKNEPDRLVCLAVPVCVHESLLTEKFGQFIVAQLNLRLVVFDEVKERITLWIG